MRVNNDIVLELTTAHWSLACMTELQPQCDTGETGYDRLVSYL